MIDDGRMVIVVARIDRARLALAAACSAFVKTIAPRINADLERMREALVALQAKHAADDAPPPAPPWRRNRYRRQGDRRRRRRREALVLHRRAVRPRPREWRTPRGE